MNHISLIGRITKDIELNTIPSGKKYIKFSIAVSDGKTPDGNEVVDFIRCVAWEERAVNIAKFFSKGNRIGISGKLKIGKYDKNGQTIETAEVRVEQFDFCESNQKTEQKPVFDTGKKVDISNDDLPF